MSSVARPQALEGPLQAPRDLGLVQLLAQREIGAGARCGPGAREPAGKRKLQQWQEADFVAHSSAHYASFQPAPRSTIALSYNCDGQLLASTHGDHTVKLTCCQTGKLVKVLSGHRRTPWVVRFHPRKPTLLASGSLDHEVRLWDADTGQCIARHVFGKPIASLAFHVSADVLAIACGHKLYVWEYAALGRTPVIVLKTRRSMRAVHFHPHGLPLALTAEVQDPSPTPDLPPTLTEAGSYLGPRPVSAPVAQQAQQQQQQQASATPSPFAAPAAQEGGENGLGAGRSTQMQEQGSLGLSTPLDQLSLEPGAGNAATSDAQPQQLRHQATATPPRGGAAPGWLPPGSSALPPSMVPTAWELPFPTGLFAGGAAAVAGAAAAAAGPGGAGANEPGWVAAAAAASLPHVMAAFSAAAWNIIGDEQPPRVRLKLWRFDAGKPTAPLEAGGNLRLQISDAVLCSEMGVHFSPCGRYLAATTACRGPLPASVGGPGAATTLTEAATVGTGEEAVVGSDTLEPAPALRDLSAALRTGVLASGGSAVASPGLENLPGLEGELRPERVVFEVRQIVIDGPAAGTVLRAKRIRAAHCLTSVQFSPCCDHLLLAYGKKHMSLLRSLQADRGSVVPLHTILEVVRLDDMSLERVLPSAEDEINAACFHPHPGGGLAYGTKEGRLRLVCHDRSGLGEEVEEGHGAKRAARGPGATASDAEEGRPSERELEGLQQWLLTQQLLQNEAAAAGGGGALPLAAAAPMAQQLEALQALWQGGGQLHPPQS